MSVMPIRVLQIMGIVNRGGVEAVIMNYYRHLDKSKVQFDFVMHKGSNQNYIDEAISMGGKVYEITPYTKNIFKFTYEIYKIVRDGNYRIVHSNMNSLSVFPLLAAYFGGATTRILHNHTTDSNKEGLRTKIKRLLRPFAKVFANQYWACSKLAAEWMYGKEAVLKGQVTIINNAIDLDRFAFSQYRRDQLRKKLGLEGKFVIGHVGRFVKAKNHEFLIDVFAEVAKQKENVVLLLIGEGPLLEPIKDKVNKLNIAKKVMFLGVRDDVADLYNIMDIFVLPSFYEGLPVVGVEAQVNGLSVLCSDKVTREVLLSRLSKLLNLQSGVTSWAETVLELSYDCRFTEKIDLTSTCFDVRSESKKLEEIYLEMS